MLHTRPSLSRRLRRLACAAALLAVPGLALSEDIDLYTGAPVNGGSPNLLILLDNAAAWNGSVNFTCPTAGVVSSNNAGKDVGFEQCSLYQAVTAIGTNPVLLGKINMGLMLFDPSSNGGWFRFPNVGRATDPGALPLMNATGVANFQTTIKTLDRQTDKSNNSAVGGGMEEMWAYFAGKTGLSGVTYHSPLSGVCQKSFVIYIANAVGNGKPQDAGNSPSAQSSLQAATGQSNPTQIVIPPPNNKYQSNWGDEWAQFMYQTDLSGGSSTNPQNIITYTIAVTDGSNPDYVQFLQSMSSHGGGKAFVVNINDPNALNALVNDLLQIFNEVQSINSVFASVSLPVSVNSQGVSLNQVYVGVFRPDPTAQPRWIGNLKQYQLGLDSNNNVITEDSLGNSAISNNGSGFISPNALSYWTSDQQTGTPRNGPLAFPGSSVVSNWPANGFWVNKPSGISLAYDAVDGEVVEKGGVGEMLRADYLTSQTGRTIYTCNGVGTCPTGTAMPKFDTSNASVTAALLGTTASDLPNLINWVRGADNTSPNNEAEPGPGGSVTVRPSIHGDVLHSRPAIINYGGSTGVVVFYGSNDGYFRAINGNQTTGIGTVRPGGELWSFIAPEFFGKLKRQRDNSPVIKLPGITDATAQPKDYFFDGTTTVYQNQSVTPATTYIYLTARRGGRFIYAFDVSTPTAPRFLWKKSSSDIPELGMTWSQPKVARIKGNTNPVLIMGGGYDTAEDVDPVQSADSMGRAIVMLDAVTGAPVWIAAPSCTGQPSPCTAVPGMTYAIPSDITLLDRDGDGNIERLYAGDLGGNIWRVDLEPNALTAPSNWTVTKIASLGGTGTSARKFFYPPDVVPTSTYDAVVAASGDREHPLASNAASNVINRFYSLRDTSTGNSVPPAWTTITESNLTDATNTLYTGSGPGFYITLTNAGEKAVNAPLTVAGYTYFGTNQPANPTNNPNMCYPNLGIARGYAISFLDGSGLNANRFVKFDGGGMPPSPIFGLVQLPTSGGGTLLTPVLIGGGNQLGLVGGNNTSSLGTQKVVPPGTGKRKRTYWYVEGVK
ncbi:pilus assembly protein PilY [Dyella sp. LX-66]|uniref:pilus assembly protein n=1 Tax=unclassified Dyella TaxID=2634549 RepID=UPI001BE01429|nr:MULTISPECIES: PilC/PilY family type IV pilus protein [unclassified Dyella]MBT2119242.1 pilus assembly protein PilY [Dyella sp. LX-1]MBT2141613.1 pilus assembly protein PilY [Dyella sp. LX-66]